MVESSLGLGQVALIERWSYYRVSLERWPYYRVLIEGDLIIGS